MKFSIVIPAFNAVGKISAALDSCREQSFPPHETIVVDDASTDGTFQFVKQHYPEVILLKLSENKGSATARNAGWERASGDYIVFLDSDDRWHPQKLEIIRHYLYKTPGLILLYHDYTLTPFTRLEPEQYAEMGTPSFWSHLIRNTAQTSCICIHKDSPVRFRTNMRYCEDYDLLLQVAYKHKTGRLPLPLTRLSRPQGSQGGLSANHRAMRNGELKAYYYLSRLHRLFFLLLPFLWLYSLLKHVRKRMLYL